MDGWITAGAAEMLSAKVEAAKTARLAVKLRRAAWNSPTLALRGSAKEPR